MNLHRLACLTLLSALPLLAACDMQVEYEELVLEEPVHSVILDVAHANFLIAGSEGETGFVDVTMRYEEDRPDLDMRVQSGVLYIDYECGRDDDDGERDECDGDVEVYLPASVRVVGTVQSGNARVTDTMGPISIHSRSGNIHVMHTAGDLDLQSGSGNIDARNVTAEVIEVIADSGNVDVDASAVPRALRAETTSGNVSVRVPSAPYRLSVATRSGNANVTNLVDDPDAPSLIFARARSGNVSVRAQ